MTKTPFAPQDMLCFALYEAHHAMMRLYRGLLDDLGLTYPQYLVLVALWQKDGVPVSAIGAQVHLESNTLTPLLKRMERDGWLSRARSTKDERQRVITLTDKGRAAKSHADQIAHCVLEATGMDAAGAQALRQSLSTLADELTAQDASKTPTSP